MVMLPAYSQKALNVKELLSIQDIYSYWNGGQVADIPQEVHNSLEIPAGSVRYPFLAVNFNAPTRITGLRFETVNGFDCGISFHLDGRPAVSGRWSDPANAGASGEVIYPLSILEQVYPSTVFSGSTITSVNFQGRDQRIYAQVGGDTYITIMDIDLDLMAYQYFTVYAFNTSNIGLSAQISVSYKLNIGKAVNG